jgi:hypothetical protein
VLFPCILFILCDSLLTGIIRFCEEGIVYNVCWRTPSASHSVWQTVISYSLLCTVIWKLTIVHRRKMSSAFFSVGHHFWHYGW